MEEKTPSGPVEPVKKKKKKRKKVSPYYVVPFFAVLTVLTVVAFILPLRPTVSQGEKRKLAEFPAFSVEALTSGSYFDDINLWFADTFPGRDKWLSASAGFKELYGYSDVVIYGDGVKNEEVPTIPTKPAVTVPSTTAPATEPTTAPTTEPTLPPTEPTYATSEPPTDPVEVWGGVDAGDDENIIWGSVLQIGDSAFEYFGFSQYWSDYYVNCINYLADCVEDNGTQVATVLIPSAVGVLVEKEYMEKVECADQEAAIDYMNACLDDKVVGVDVFQTLVDHNDEYIYFRTDHHWTALGAYYAYVELCKSLNMEPAPLDSFEVWDQGTFEGSLYWQCNQSSRLKLDNVYAYNPPGDLEMWITRDGYSFEWTVLTDMQYSDDNSKYMTFLGGDHYMTEITNHDLPDGPTCVVVKDSFGNPLVPFLTQNYHKIYVLDFRKYDAMNLAAFASVYDVDQIIFAHMLGMAQTEGANSLFGWLCAY